ncbi:MAG: diaminopimelate epimerase [Chromatiales bacterium]|nr:diaminopimelate epimerase [Chromatiales bacterium]
MTRIPFTKMQALGNDFVLMREPDSAGPLQPDRIRALADRRTGIGFDQLLWLGPPRTPGAALSYRVFNTDGSEAEQCGNGARCIARQAAGGKPGRLVLDAPGGPLPAELHADGTVSIAMGEPEFAPARVPFLADSEGPEYPIAVDGRQLRIGVVALGNPHAVLQVPDVASAPVATLGPLLERHECFPNRANIGFMEVAGRGHIRLRVFERGVGETRACGSGACAAAAVGRRLGLLDANVRVSLPGGDLHISWPGPGSTLLMRGEAISVFEGTIDA